MGWKKPPKLVRNYSSLTPKPKTAQEDMDRMLKEFFARGGVIQKIPAGKTTKK